MAQHAKATIVANLILIGGGLLCALLAVFLFSRYAWKETGQSAGATGVLYYALPAAGAALLLAALRLKPGHKTKLVALCLFLIAFAYGIELFVMSPEPRPWIEARPQTKDEVVRLAGRYGIEFDTRNHGEVVADLRKQGNDAVPVILTGLPSLEEQNDGTMRSVVRIDGAEVIPLGGIANKLTVLCNQSGEYVAYQSDERGFHNPKGIWGAGRVEIAAVGNSFTHGYCVPSDKNFVALIRKRYPATLNLGMAGDGPLMSLATVKEYLPRLKPKTLLWFYFEGNQLGDLEHEKKTPLLMRYLENGFSQNLLERQSDIDRSLTSRIERRTAPRTPTESTADIRNDNKGLRELLRSIKLTELRRISGLLSEISPQQRLEMASRLRQNVDLLRAILSRAKTQVSEWDASLVFVYHPTWGRYARDDAERLDSERREVLALVRSLEIPLIDALPAFDNHGDPLSLFPFRRFYHYNEEGHRLVAEEVLKAIPALTSSAS
jgi:hypothetical protein